MCSTTSHKMKSELVLSIVVLASFCLVNARIARLEDRRRMRSTSRATTAQPPRVPNAMLMDTFRSQVTGQSYKELYLLQEPADEYASNTKNFNITMTFLTPTIVMRAYNTRWLGSCIEDASNMVTQSRIIRRAIFKVPEIDLTIWYFSTRPDQFLFEFGCYDQNFNKTTCFGDFFMSMYTANDPPHQFPWIFALRELFRQTHLTVLDPRTLYTRILSACPE